MVISSLAVIVVSKYAWNAHLKHKNRIQPLIQQQTDRPNGEQATSTASSSDLAVIRVVRQSEEPYVFFKRSG